MHIFITFYFLFYFYAIQVKIIILRERAPCQIVADDQADER